MSFGTVSSGRYREVATTVAKTPDAEEVAEAKTQDTTNNEQVAAQTETAATSTQQWAVSQGIESHPKMLATAGGANDIDDILKSPNPAGKLLLFIQQHSDTESAGFLTKVLAQAPDPAKLISEISAGGGQFPPLSKSFMLTLFDTALNSSDLPKGPAITDSWSKSAGLEKGSTTLNRTGVCLRSIFDQLTNKLAGREVLDLAIKVNTSSLTAATNTHYHYLYHNARTDSTVTTNAAADLLAYIVDKGGPKLDRSSLSELKNAVTNGPLKGITNTESGQVAVKHTKWISNHHGGGHTEIYYTSEAYKSPPTPSTKAILDRIDKLLS